MIKNTREQQQNDAPRSCRRVRGRTSHGQLIEREVFALPGGGAGEPLQPRPRERARGDVRPRRRVRADEAQELAEAEALLRVLGLGLGEPARVPVAAGPPGTEAAASQLARRADRPGPQRTFPHRTAKFQGPLRREPLHSDYNRWIPLQNPRPTEAFRYQIPAAQEHPATET